MNRELYDNYVRHVIKYGSLTNAAKVLGISQPALSQGVSALEKELGFKIINRRTNPVTVTYEGELYLKHLDRIDYLNLNFKRNIDNLICSKNNSVVIAGPAVYVNTIIVPSVIKLIDEHPDYNVGIKTASLEAAVRMASRGEVDVFISTRGNLPESFIQEQIFQENIVLCVPEGDSLNDKLKDEFDISCIAEHRVIRLEDGFPLQRYVDEYLGNRGIDIKRNITVNQVSLAVQMVEQGRGICFASREATIGKSVITYPVDIQGRFIYMAHDKELYISEACKKLMEIIRDNSK